MVAPCDRTCCTSGVSRNCMDSYCFAYWLSCQFTSRDPAQHRHPESWSQGFDRLLDPGAAGGLRYTTNIFR